MKFNARARAVILSVALLITGTSFMVQPASAASFNNVQIFANPISNRANNFQFAAYNLSGSLVASYQSPYPAAAFELPSGGYLFTVSATDYTPHVGYACPLPLGPGTVQPAAPPTQGGSKAIIPWCYPPSSEYGYSVTTVNGPQSISIDLKNASRLPTTAVTVKVSYVNGTTVKAANVYSSVVGEWYYYWWYKGSGLNMSGLTDGNGVAHLVVPVAPTVITAWKWVPVYVKTNATTEVNIGGQKVNVTAYWQPTYVGLSGSGLIIPPQNSADITVRYQQPQYWVMTGIASRQAYVNGVPTATVANQPTGMPSSVSASNAQSSNQYYLPSQIPAFQAGAQTSGQATPPSVGVIIASAVAFVAAAFGVVFAAARRRSVRPPIQ